MSTTTFGRAKRTLLLLGLLSSIALLTGCGGSSNNNDEEPIIAEPIIVATPSKSAVVQTVSPDFSSSEVAYLDSETQSVAGDFYIGASDYTLASFGSDVYHIGRRSIDTVEKYNSESPDEQIFSFTTNDDGEVSSSNPYALVFANTNKAYLIRYGSSDVWVVNPNATEEADFKIGELDLSAYIPADNTKGTPSPAGGVIVDNKLYISMQRLSDSFGANTAYVAVFDVETDIEIETNNNSNDSVMGIMLSGQNPLEHSIKAAFGDVYVTSNASFSNPDLTVSMIEKIETSDYSVSIVLSAADIADNTGAFISSSEIVSTTQGYFVATVNYNADGEYDPVSTIYQFNPTTGSIDVNNVAGTGTEDISFIGLDNSGFLWVSAINPSTPGVDIINTETNEYEGSRLLTELNPGTIRFLD